MRETLPTGGPGVPESACCPAPHRYAARSRAWRHQRQLRIMRHRSMLQVGVSEWWLKIVSCEPTRVCVHMCKSVVIGLY